MDFLSRIKEGLEGKYKGLDNGLGRINKYIFGLQRSVYMLFGGLSGAAKTTLVDFMLLNAIDDAISKNINVNVFYYSLEIDEVTKKANWLSNFIYKKYNIIIPPEKIKGLGEFRLNEDELQIVESELPELEKIWSKINWIWESTNPTGIYMNIWRFMESKGKFIKEPYIDEHGNKKERIVKYINNDPDEYNILVVDHIALLSLERSFTLKDNIDKFSEYCVRLRNLFGLTIIAVQQFNQSLNSVDRMRFKGVDVSPQQSDFKDSSNPYQDCDIALGIMNAYKMDLDSYLGYNIRDYVYPQQGFLLRERFRSLKIIKNRLSRDNISIGLLFTAEAGTFEELPTPEDLIKDHNFIRKISNLISKK